MRRRASAGAFVVALVVAMLSLLTGRAEAAPTHVGLVVRFADGNVRTACATVGGSGLAVLRRKFTVVVGQAPPYAGFVFTINGTGTTHPDTTHYWSYWHAPSGGGWTYSGAGAGSYTPKAGTVEGWSYVNGSNTAPKPPVYTYAALCASSDPKAATPASKTASTTPSKAAVTTPTRAANGATHARSTSPAAASRTVSRTTGTAGPRSSSPARHPAPAASATSAAGALSASSSSASPNEAAAGGASSAPAESSSGAAAGDTRRADTGFPAWGTVIAAVAAAAIAVAAWQFNRRRTD